MKQYLVVLALLIGANGLFAGNCSNTKIDFTFYGGKKKDYIVTKNTFKKVKVTGNKLLGATAEIDLTSVDTSADMNNGKNGATNGPMWPASMANIRNNNTKNTLFKTAKTAKAKIVKVSGGIASVEIAINGKTKIIKMKKSGSSYQGKLNVTDFLPSAWKNFERLCKGFHRGKSFSELDIFFTPSKSCK
ncbi:MAG: hypothetical protein OIF32_11785 [Campylobacterales bacterium]|nr:hypothetical protein [Campylobacterales bacterium]